VPRPVVEDLVGIEPEGAIGRVGERFPLGRGIGRIELGNEPPTGPQTRPFGLRYLTPIDQRNVRVLDLSQVTYDPKSQMSRLDGELLIHAATKQQTQHSYKTTEDKQVYDDFDTDEVAD
jgi:putative ATP-grasp target RiPP